MKELIIERENVTTIFMAALLSCTEDYKDALVRKIKPGETMEAVNVTRTNIEKLCPSWASSELISRMIAFKVCGPITDTHISIDEKVKKVKSVLAEYAKREGLELPS